MCEMIPVLVEVGLTIQKHNESGEKKEIDGWDHVMCEVGNWERTLKNLLLQPID